MPSKEKEEQLKQLLAQAEKGIKDVFESERYKSYLTAMSKFHNYSFRNTLLITLQKPEATHVAGYVAWQKNFNRQVQRGEKGIQILGYTPKNITVIQERKDSTGKVIIGTDGKPETKKVTKQIPSYIPVYVYDISQTEGDPLPQLLSELTGNVDSYKNLMAAIMEVSPFPIVFEDIRGGAKGYCDPVEQKIAINNDMSETQTIKTAIHEVTHADLHAPEIHLKLIEQTDRRTKEVEAESTAFVVCSHYGIDTSDYTFPYVAAWSSTKELKELQGSLEIIQKQASELIEKIDTQLIALQQNIEKDQVTELNAAHRLPDKSISIDEMEGYGFKNDATLGIDMLPLNKERAGDLFQQDTPIYLLYSNNTAVSVNGISQIEDHAAQGGLFGINADDWRIQEGLENQANKIAQRYDALIGDDKAGREAHPFSILDKEQRHSVIVSRISAYDVDSLDRIVDFMIADIPTEQEEKRSAAIMELTKIKADLDSYMQNRLSLEVEKFNGEPVVSIRFSENPALKTGQIFPLHKANEIFRHLDESHSGIGYDKTAFCIKYKLDGEYNIYNGRQDFGDKDGSMIEHIQSLWEYELSPNVQSLHIAHGNESILESANEIVNRLVPYLKLHDSLGLLNDYSTTQLSNLDKMGVSITGSEQLKDYHAAILDYVNEARTAINESRELPPFPERAAFGLSDISDTVLSSELKTDLAQIAEYKEEVKREIELEAKAAGITPDQYVSAGSIAPEGRTFTIYQLKNNDLTRPFRFESLDFVKQQNGNNLPSFELYEKKYSGILPEGKGLDDIFTEFNINRPADFAGHSLSVSDLIAIEYQGSVTVNYVDRYGFENIPEYATEIASVQGITPLEQKIYTLADIAVGTKIFDPSMIGSHPPMDTYDPSDPEPFFGLLPQTQAEQEINSGFLTIERIDGDMIQNEVGEIPVQDFLDQLNNGEITLLTTEEYQERLAAENLDSITNELNQKIEAAKQLYGDSFNIIDPEPEQMTFAQFLESKDGNNINKVSIGVDRKNQAAPTQQPLKKMSMKERLSTAQTEADQRNESYDSKKSDHEKPHSKEEI